MLNYLQPQLQLHYIMLLYASYTTLHSTSLHYTQSHYTRLHYNYHYNYNIPLHFFL